MEVMVEVDGLVKTFIGSDGRQVEAVKGISFDIQKGEIFSLLGPNGAGKTSTISMISGLIAPTSGDARIGGYSITKNSLAAKRLIGAVPQEIALYPELNARQNLEFFGSMYGLNGKELRDRVDEVLEFIDLTDRQKDRIETFSGGMKRRVNLAVGLLHRPQLLYLDEPTVGIDPQNRRRILDTILQLRDDYGMTVLYTTHLMEEAQELSDRVAIIDHGEIIALGTHGELTQRVGEEDRLLIHVSDQDVSDELLRRIEVEVVTVTRATYHAIPSAIAPGSKGVIVRGDFDSRSTGELTGTRAGQTKDGAITVYAKRGRKALPAIIRLVDDAGIVIQSVEVKEPDLEAVFLHLTGRALRD